MTDNQYKKENSNIDDPLLHRGCQLSEEYAPGKKVLSCGRCKLNQFDWLKDYEGQNVEGNVCLAEVRFKNDRKDYFVYPEDLNLEVGELVAVEAAIGHDIGIVTLLGEIVERQMKRKHFRTPINEMKSIYRRARANDVEKWLSAIKLEKDTLSRTRVIAENLGLEMKLNSRMKKRDEQKQMIKAGKACSGNMNWTVNGSKSQGNKMVKDMQKLLLRAFNNDCDDIVRNVKLSNMDKSKERIRVSAGQISNLGQMMSISITPAYINSKYEELALALDFVLGMVEQALTPEGILPEVSH